MSRFVKVPGQERYINADEICEFGEVSEYHVVLIFTNGHHETIAFSIQDNMEHFVNELLGENSNY